MLGGIASNTYDDWEAFRGESLRTLPASVVLALTFTFPMRAEDSPQIPWCGPSHAHCEAPATTAQAVNRRLSDPNPIESKSSPQSPSWLIKEWTVSDFAPLLAANLRARDFERGRVLFSAAHCADCHRFGAAGGAVGPDLSGLAGRLSSRQVLEAVLEPNSIISDQYATIVFQTTSGRRIVGRILSSNSHEICVRTNELDPLAVETIPRQDVSQLSTSKVSTMPTGLLNALMKDDVLDLLAYLLSRGNPDHAMFRPHAGTSTPKSLRHDRVQ